MLTDQGRVTVEVDEDEASLIGRHWNAIGAYLSTGNVEQLARFVGRRAGGRPFVTDPDTIESLATIGEIDHDGPGSERV
jgi:hypothetical protein